jgi:Fe-S-cluster containining protein
MIEIKPFVPKDVCRACQGCCRFHERGTVWSPLFLTSEIEVLTGEGVLEAGVFLETNRASRINLMERGDILICPCLDYEANRCRIYRQRPFDCRLYPFLLARRDKEVFAAVDEKCPYAFEVFKNAEPKEYLDELTRALDSEVFSQAVKKDPDIVQVYCQDIRFLRPLPYLSSNMYGTFPSDGTR